MKRRQEEKRGREEKRRGERGRERNGITDEVFLGCFPTFG